MISTADWHRPVVRWGVGGAQKLLLVALVIIGLGPILWLAKSAITPTSDTISHPMALFRHGAAWSNLRDAWVNVDVGRYFWNTIVLAIGSWAVQIGVATTGGFALSVLKPRYGKVIYWLLLMTLFIPAVVLLVPLYIEIVHPPLIHHTFIDSYWAIWLPAGASAFNVVLVKRFFDNLPHEIFEAAKIDGAGPFQLFWRVCLPMSKPILGVVSVFAVLASWKDFLWPLLVLTNPDKQPLSVRLPEIQSQTDLGVFLAAMFIACLVPIVAFLIFQRTFLRGTGLGGALKG
jgi:multiple sugar transport system permease protein